MSWIWLVVTLGGAARAPNQTKVQSDVWYHWYSNAATLSDAAKLQLLSAFDNTYFRNEIKNLPIAQNSSTTLLHMLDSEISYSDSIHNIPFHNFMRTLNLQPDGSFNASLGGVPFDVVDKLKYLPTIWEEIALGLVQWGSQWDGYNKIQTILMKYPNMPLPPTLPAAYDRPLYSSLNVWKKSAGNLEFGNIALFFDRFSGNSKKIFISPIDSGCFFGKCMTTSNSTDINVTGGEYNPFLMRGNGRDLRAQANCGGVMVACNVWNQQMATTSHFYHAVLPHLAWWRCSLASFFNRWYGGTAVCPDVGSGMGAYFEAMISGAFLIPEDLLYAVIKYDDFFGRSEGKTMQNWAKGIHRPLAYANDDRTGSVLDATVGAITGSYNITQKDRDELNAMWGVARPVWSKFHTAVTYNLHLSFRGYYAVVGKYCDVSQCVGCHFLGANHYRACLYWK